MFDGFDVSRAHSTAAVEAAVACTVAESNIHTHMHTVNESRGTNIFFNVDATCRLAQ